MIEQNERLQFALDYAKNKAVTRVKLDQYLYFVRCGRYIKIGIAADVTARVNGMQTGCPYELKLLDKFQCSDPVSVERALHDRFDRYHHRGEWFKIPMDQLNDLSRLIDWAKVEADHGTAQTYLEQGM